MCLACSLCFWGAKLHTWILFFLAFVLQLVSFKEMPAWLCMVPHIGFYVVTFQCNKKGKFSPLRHLPAHLNPSDSLIAAGIYIRISLTLQSAFSFIEHYSEDKLPGLFFVKFWSRFLKFFSCFHLWHGEKVENANRQPFYSLIQHPKSDSMNSIVPFFLEWDVSFARTASEPL